MSTVGAVVSGVARLLAQNVGRCKEKMEQQQLVCLQDKERIAQMLVREALLFQTLVGGQLVDQLRGFTSAGLSPLVDGEPSGYRHVRCPLVL